MFLSNPLGFQGLINLLTVNAETHADNYQQAAQACVMSGTPTGPAAYHLGAQKSAVALIEILNKIQTGEIK